MGRLILCIIFPPAIPFVVLHAIFTGGSGVKKGLRANNHQLRTNGRKIDINTMAILDPDKARAMIKQDEDAKIIGGIVTAIIFVGIVSFIYSKMETGSPATIAQPAYVTVVQPAYTPAPAPAPVFVQPSAPVPAPSVPTSSAATTLVEQLTTRLVLDYNAYWSQGGTNVENIAQYYATQVTFYNGSMTREKVMDEKRKFSARWPVRHFTVVPNSLFVQCGNDGVCTATGIVAWDCTSRERGEHSVGTANFAYRIVNGVIVSENGSVLTGHKDKI
jgi:hypothetical protein